MTSLSVHPFRLAPAVPVPRRDGQVDGGCVRGGRIAEDVLGHDHRLPAKGAATRCAVLLGEVVKTKWVAGPPVTVSLWVSLVSVPETVMVGVPELVSP